MLVLLGAVDGALGGDARVSEATTTLWYDALADAWTEALPVGNGRLVAMVVGRVDEDIVCAGSPRERGATVSVSVSGARLVLRDE